MDQLDRLQQAAVWHAAELGVGIRYFDCYERETGGPIFPPKLRQSVSGNQLRSAAKALKRPHPRLKRANFDLFKHIKLKPGHHPDSRTMAELHNTSSKKKKKKKKKEKEKRVQFSEESDDDSSSKHSITQLDSPTAFAMSNILFFPLGKVILGIICQAYVRLFMDRHGSGSTGPPNYVDIQVISQAMPVGKDGKRTTDIAVLTIPCPSTAQDHALTDLPIISACGTKVFVTIEYNLKSNVSLLEATKQQLLDIGCGSIVTTSYKGHIYKARKHGISQMTYCFDLPPNLICNANLDCNTPLHKKTPDAITPFPVKGALVENKKSKKLSPTEEESTAIVLILGVEDAEAHIDADYSSDDASAENDQFIESIANGYQKRKANGTKSEDRTTASHRPALTVDVEEDELAQAFDQALIISTSKLLWCFTAFV